LTPDAFLRYDEAQRGGGIGVARVPKVLAIWAGAILWTASLTTAAQASMTVKSVFDVRETYTDTFVCPFDVRVHLDGSFKNVDFYDTDGFLYRSIATPGGGGPFTVTYTAKGTTLRQQSEAFSTVITYNRDGSVRTYTQRGPFDRFTVRGTGIVLLDTGIAVFSEPDETLLFSGGPHQAVNGDFEAFCASFGA
jgi:hypothetical protein